MILDASVDAEFAERGYVHVPGALPVDVVSRASAAVERLYSSPEANIGHPGGRTDGTTQYCSDSGLFELYSHPVLESVARFILRTEAVILQSAAILHNRPLPPEERALAAAAGQLWTEKSEHVDIQYTLEEIDGSPRVQTCMIMVLLDDLPLGRANTYLRPGSHRQISNWLAETGGKPYKAHPTFKIGSRPLPLLPFAEPEPATGVRGDVIPFCTNVVHCASTNITTEARKVMFINFCHRSALDSTAGNHDLVAIREGWRDALRAGFPPDRRQLLDGVETNKISPRL